MLERLELEVFLTLAEELHFGRTATRLRVSPARISQIVKKLERLVGAPLFARTSRTVALTALGRQLHDDLLPGYERIRSGLDRAIDTVRSGRETLRVGFIGAAAGQLLVWAADMFGDREPECRVHLKEVQPADCLRRLHDGDIHLLILSQPHARPDMITGPTLFSEQRMLAVPSDHPFSRRPAVTLEDLADVPLLQSTGALPGDWRHGRTPRWTPQGRVIPVGPGFETFQEALALIGAGKGAFIVGAQATRFYARSDVIYLPLTDAPPLEWVPTWPVAADTRRVRAFVHITREVAVEKYAR